VETIKIITINTWKCDGDYNARINILAEQLQALKPAIVACQECFYSDEGNADTLKFLADSLQMNYTFVPGRFKKRYFDGEWVDSFSGLGILSAYPLTAIGEFDLPPVPGDEDRKAQQAEITLPAGKKLLLTNTHLTHLNNTLARKTQAEALAGIATADQSHNYNIICGDFNATLDSIEIKAFMNKANAVDCYKSGNGTEPRHSLANAFSRNIHICVDHIFALPVPGENRYPEFINANAVLNVQDKTTGLYPSDHFGIGVDLVID
jgi:endonuclease/exonuclease/phosphatase family metal-dependent hydrolase